MSQRKFDPTDEQKAVIGHVGSAFISACPGAGKTQVLVERARQELKNNATGQGLAFLSFTNAAISELKSRLQAEGLLPSPPFPHYVGTFDTFIWHFFVAVLGIPEQLNAPRLIPDLEERTVAPPKKTFQLPLFCFDTTTGKMIPEKAKQAGFPAQDNPSLIAQYEESARSCRERFLARGELSFSGVRSVVRAHLKNKPLSDSLSAALGARFREIIVDEAQDCNPEDIEIINWLRDAGITTKVICDPHQSIYEFRGGVTDQLFVLKYSFDSKDRLTMTGNFRSNQNICNAISSFRDPGAHQATDKSLGLTANDVTPVYVLLYPGKAIPPAIGERFKSLVHEHGLTSSACPVVSSTRDGAYRAIGQAGDSATQHRTLRLALAASTFHAGLEVGARKQAMESVHRIMLELGGKLGQKTYFQHISAEGLKPEDWRPLALTVLQSLRYGHPSCATPETWLKIARSQLSPFLGENSGTISQKLSNHQDLAVILGTTPLSDLNAGTIHSVKGMQYPGICVVMNTQTAKGIVDYLATGQPSQNAEGARKLYVGASRAERLLVLAIPKTQGERLITHINKTGAIVKQFVLT